MLPNDALYRTESFAIEEAKWLAHEQRHAMIEARAKDLLQPGADCYPWTVANMFEALTNMELRCQLVVGTYIASAADLPDNVAAQAGCGLVVVRYIREYWEKVAREVAEKQLRGE